MRSGLLTTLWYHSGIAYRMECSARFAPFLLWVQDPFVATKHGPPSRIGDQQGLVLFAHPPMSALSRAGQGSSQLARSGWPIYVRAALNLTRTAPS